MKAPALRYLNEITGLTLMALLAVALIAGEAAATGHQSVPHDTAYAATQPAPNPESRQAIRKLISVKLHTE